MSFDPKDYSPIVNDWFETELKYAGMGYAEFQNPKGWVRGQATVEVAESGEFTVEMEIEDFDCGETLGLDGRRGDRDWLLSGRKPELKGNLTLSAIVPGWPANSCLKFEVKTEKGTFWVIDREIHYQYLFNKVKFYSRVAYFDCHEKAKSKHWVLPISNFTVLPFVQPGNHPLYNHPLRFFLPPPVPEGLSDEHRRAAYAMANSRNNLTVFRFGRAFAFLEPLPDFEKRRETLEEAQVGNLITAVMVGRTGNNSVDWPSAMDWLPIDAIHLLSLASGNLAGSPWIEFRAADGRLVRRIHATNLWQANFQKGHAAIDVRYIGRLLSHAPRKLPAHLRVAIRHVVKGGRKGLGTEDNFSFLVRALDSLTEPLKSQSYNPNQFDEERWQQVQELLKTTGRQINEIANQAGKAGNADEERCERAISQRVYTAANLGQRLSFAEAMATLLSQYGLPDGEILQRFYETNPRTDGMSSLEQVVSAYRGRSIHENYFVLSDGTHDVRDIGVIQHHVHDILLRIILKNLGYDGNYHSVLAPGDQSLDWVTPSTPASKLGY